MRFLEKEGYILDTKTYIHWSKDNAGMMSWEEAITSAPKGWRLPTIAELLSIVNHVKGQPVTELPNMLSDYYSYGHWSATTYENRTDYATIFDFDFRQQDIRKKSCTCFVRYIESNM